MSRNGKSFMCNIKIGIFNLNISLKSPASYAMEMHMQ